MLEPAPKLTAKPAQDTAQDVDRKAEEVVTTAQELDSQEAFRETKHVRAALDEQNRTSALCTYLESVLKLRTRSGSSTVNVWPKGCSLPSFLQLSKGGMPATHELMMITDVAAAESQYQALPPGGIAVLSLPSSGEKTAQGLAESLIWQALYKVNSYMYFEDFTGLHSEDLGLPSLSHAAFIPGHVLLQKGTHPAETKLLHSNFFHLAYQAETDKADSNHNYTLLYHPYLDTFPKDQHGTFLEIGLGCNMPLRHNKTNIGASAKVWPKLLPQLSTNFLELDRDCVEQWKPQMRKDGVSKVYVGSQADPLVLEEISKDARKTLGGLQIVVDDGSHQCHHIEQTFRLLFPQVASQGLYFVEDMMFSAWATLYSQKISTKDSRTEGTPIALAAVLGAAAAGIDRDSFPPHTWADNILDSYGALVDLVECTPGICVFKRA